jgi:hypothetical protein
MTASTMGGRGAASALGGTITIETTVDRDMKSAVKGITTARSSQSSVAAPPVQRIASTSQPTSTMIPQKINPISGLPPRHNLKLTEVRLKAMERLQIQQAKRHMKSKAKSRHGGHRTSRSNRSARSQQSTARSQQSSSTSSSTARSQRSQRSQQNTARSQKTNAMDSARSTKSWSSSISINSNTSNMTAKALDRIIKLEEALDRERSLRERAEQQLANISVSSGSSVGSTSSRRAY